MSEIFYLKLEEVLAIHHDQIQRYGGARGIRDFDLLISAISRPQATFSGSDLYVNIFEKASALMHSLIFNHPFVDGNKRTAFVVCARSLYMNGYVLKISEKDIVRVSLKVESKEWNLNKLSKWLKKNSKKI